MARANKLVDEKAKDALLIHPVADDDQFFNASVDATEKRARPTMRVMAATLRLYPFGEMTRLEAPKKQARAKTAGDKRKNKARWHEWAATLTGWQCGLCKALRN